MIASLVLALALWARGLNVIPIPRPRSGVAPGRPGDGKVPAQPWGEWQTRRQTEADIRKMFVDESNIAIVTGAVSGVVVIDADSPESLRYATTRLVYTPWQTQTPKGWHLFYRAPDVRVSNRARIETPAGRLAIDLRGDGGFVIAPGSIHASGARYEYAGDWSVPREELPVFWPGWLARPRRETASRPSVRPTGDVIERARKYLAAIPRPEIGAGSDVATLSAACRLVRGFELSADDATALLWAWAGGRPGWTHEWIAAKVAHARRYGTDPIGALR